MKNGIQQVFWIPAYAEDDGTTYGQGDGIPYECDGITYAGKKVPVVIPLKDGIQ